MSWQEDGDEPTAGEYAWVEQLADRCGLTVQAFVETFGAGWCLWSEAPTPLVSRPDRDRAPSGDPTLGDSSVGLWDDVRPWFITGYPPQLVLRPGDEWIELGIPRGQWAGHELSWHVERLACIPAGPGGTEEGRHAVSQLLRVRRASFRYCRYCRRLTAPEERLEATTCLECASLWHGAVY